MQSPTQEMHLDIVQNTSVFNKILNVNCCFDGSSLIYLAGAHIVFHNVFQNSKHFLPRATSHPPVALAFHRAIDTSIAVISKLKTQTFLEFYFPEKNPISIQLHYDLEVFDCMFFDRKKVCILCIDMVRRVPMILTISSNRKLSKLQASTPLLKFILGDRRIICLQSAKNVEGILSSSSLNTSKGINSDSLSSAQLGISGCIQFLLEGQTLGQSLYKGLDVVDLFIIEEAQIVVTAGNRLLVFVDKVLSQQIDLRQYNSTGSWGCGNKIGRSLVFAFKNQLTVAYFQWTQGKLAWGGSFEYSERLRANIVSMHHSADQMNILLATQINHKQSWTLEFFLFNCGALSNEKKFINAFSRLIPSGAETGDLVSLQKVVASQVYLLAGPSIVNYSYVDHIEKKHKYVIHESPRLIAVHPLGFQILCTFEGSLKFYQRVQQQLIEIWSEAWTCSAATYTQSGLLLLCLSQEGGYQIVLYDPNSFKRIKNYSSLYLKHAVTQIEFDETESEMILWSNKDLSVYKLKNGQKVSEFRQKKEGIQATCIQYDSNRRLVLAGLKKGLVLCRKNQEYHLNFSCQKRIDIEDDPSCILIKQCIETVFIGTSDGKILFTKYPLNPIEETLCEQTVYKISYKIIRVHSSPIADLLLTNNNKYLFTTSKGEGLAIIRVKKSNMGGYYNSFDISNYNFIQTSSKPYLEIVQERLKGLLEKRKAIFNELQEYKKQWEAKRQQESKAVSLEQKKKELTAINSALHDISLAKAQHQRLQAQLNQLIQKEALLYIQNQQAHHSDLLVCYDQNDRLKKQREGIQNRCQMQFSEIEKQCSINLKDIEKEIKQKYQEFQQQYQIMRQNLLSFELKAQIEANQEEILDVQEIAEARTRLRKQEDQLYRRNNQLKGQITRNRKQMERFLNRKDFLENKQRFFTEQLRFCACEQEQLRKIKEELEEELNQLEKDTQKKEKKLRKYFIENQMLLKYQIVHDNLTKTTDRQANFILQEQSTLKGQIHQLQQEIITITDNKAHLQKETVAKRQQANTVKSTIKQLKAKGEYLELQVKELERLLATVGPGRQEQLHGLYEKFFVGKRLEGAIDCPRFQEKEKKETKQVQLKIRQQLQDHKNYLVKNMNTFQKVNSKAFEQIQSSYLKYQSQNYALISECNVRKEQISKKKRILQEMANSMRETQNHINQLQSPQFVNTKHTNHKREESLPRKIPFVEYEKQQQLRKEKSQSVLYKTKNISGQVRKMLDVQKLVSPQSRVKPTRRIQTACAKKVSQLVQAVVEQDCGGWMITKPQTACKRSRGAQQEARRLFSRNKSSSKPTTCTSHSKYSVFI